MHLSRPHIYVFLGLSAIFWFACLLFFGVPVSWEFFKPFSITVGLLLGVGWLFENHLWSEEKLFFLSKRPDIRGTWSVELQSNWKNPETGQVIEPIQCYAVITQSFSKLELTLMTKESRSWLMSSDFTSPNKSDGIELFGVYTNQPKRELRDTRSQIHNGAFRFQLHGPKSKPDSMEGEYWTDRSTGGSLNFHSRIKEERTTYETAEAAFSTHSN